MSLLSERQICPCLKFDLAFIAVQCCTITRKIAEFDVVNKKRVLFMKWSGSSDPHR